MDFPSAPSRPWATLGMIPMPPSRWLVSVSSEHTTAQAMDPGQRPAPISPPFPHLQGVSPWRVHRVLCLSGLPESRTHRTGDRLLVWKVTLNASRAWGSGVGTSYCPGHLGQPVAVPLEGGEGCLTAVPRDRVGLDRGTQEFRREVGMCRGGQRGQGGIKNCNRST